MKTPEKKKVYKSKYQNGWEIEFTWVTKSEKGNSFAFCKLCQRHFSVSHAGKNDVKKHGNTDLHSRSLKTSKHLQSVSDFVVTKTDQDVIRAETLFSNFIAEHNLPFLIADHFNKLSKKMFPDFRKPSNQHTDEVLAVGIATRTYLHDIKDTVDPAVTDKFFRSVRNFYSAVVEKLLKKFPFDESLLQHLGFLDPDMRDTLTADSVVMVAKRFPVLIPEDKLDDLAEEYRDFQAAPNTELPKYEKDITRIDQFWGELALLTNKITKQKLYPLLSKVALGIVILPNSNADCERTFSMVRKVQTELRSDLENDTLCALLSCKINQQCQCFTFDPSAHMLNLAKTATNQYNKSLEKERLLLPSAECFSDTCPDSLN